MDRTRNRKEGSHCWILVSVTVQRTTSPQRPANASRSRSEWVRFRGEQYDRSQIPNGRAGGVY